MLTAIGVCLIAMSDALKVMAIAFIIDAIANIASPFFIYVYRERQRSESYAEVKAELDEKKEE